MKISTKKMMIGGLIALTMGLVGCDLLNSNKDSGPTITTQPTDQTVALGSNVTFTIAATGTGTLRYVWLVSGDTVQDSSVSTLTGPPGALDDGAKVKCIVIDSKGSTTSNEVTIHVTGLTAYPAAVTKNLGGQAHPTLGSAIDLDADSVYTSAIANANPTKIDLVYLYYNNAAHLDGAAAAKDSGVKYSINLTNTYPSTVVNIMMVKVTAKPASQQAAKEIYDDGTPVRSSVVANGDKFIVKTTGGKYVYVEVLAVAGTTAGTADLSVFVSTL